MGIVVQAPPPPRADSAPGTTLPSCPAAPGGEEAGQAGRLLRLGEAQRFRPSRQVSARPRGLGLLCPRLPRRASGSWGGGRGCGGHRPRGELGSNLGRARARLGRARGAARVRVRVRVRAGLPGSGTPLSAPSPFCACARPCRPWWRPRAPAVSGVPCPGVIAANPLPPGCPLDRPLTSFPPALGEMPQPFCTS